MILYFSGTGNTRRCAELLGKLTGDSVAEIACAALREPQTAHYDISDGRLILMFPTYSWGIPPVVRAILERGRFDFPNGTEAWMVTTCGDDIGNAAAQWRKAMRRIGLSPRNAYSVQMPNTYVCMSGFDIDSPAVEQAKVDAMPARLHDIAARITSNDSPGHDNVVRGRFAWLKTAVIYPWFVRHNMQPCRFNVSDACISCGLCQRSCPMQNITADADGRPVWGDKCALCLRCYHICPHHAVGYSKATRDKGRYTRYLH